MHLPRFRGSLFFVALVALSSCEHQERPAPDPASAAKLGRHWMQGERLKKVMGQVAGLHDAFPKGLSEDVESTAGKEARRTLAEAASVADALANTAQSIPTAIEGKPMSDADRRGFLAEATRLHNQAIALRDAARANKIEPLQGMQDNINATCIACHSRYRDISGELNTHKAAAPRFGQDTATAAIMP